MRYFLQFPLFNPHVEIVAVQNIPLKERLEEDFVQLGTNTVIFVAKEDTVEMFANLHRKFQKPILVLEN